MTDIDERTRAREAMLQSQVGASRRLARPEDYVYDKSQEKFWDLKDGTLNEALSVDASIPLELWRVEVTEPPPPDPDAPPRRGRPAQRRERLIKPSADIMRVENDQFVEGATWWPGKGQIVKDYFIDNKGFYPAAGRRIYNKYKGPPESQGDPDGAGPWIDHVKRLWPDPKEHEFFFNYCAHMVQFPHIKCNAAIVLSGKQGIGKDVALEAVKYAIGTWNMQNIDPDQLLTGYNPWVETLMLVVDEVRPAKDDFNATTMYNILKPMIAAPPHTLAVNDKYAKLRHIINVLRVFITTNDWMSMYIPPEDRRMFIMHSNLEQRWHEAEGMPNYFQDFVGWREQGGDANVAAWLAARDLSSFNPKAQIERTAGWQAVANSWGEPEDAVSQALELLGQPDIVFGAELTHVSFDGKEELAGMIKSPRKFGFRMQKAGYTSVAPEQGDRWTFNNNGKLFRSRLAYAKPAVMADRARLMRMINERGMAVAGGQSAVPAGVKEKEGF